MHYFFYGEAGSGKRSMVKLVAIIVYNPPSSRLSGQRRMECYDFHNKVKQVLQTGVTAY